MSAEGRIGILCVSAIPDDPRVRKQADILHDAGYRVAAIGLPGYRSGPPRWVYDDGGGQKGSAALAFDTEPDGATRPRVASALRSRLGGAAVRLRLRAQRLADLVRTHVEPRHALSVYWRLNTRFQEMYERASRHRADLWLANDWTTLPMAMKLAERDGVPYLYDTHELGADEYGHRLRWRLLQQPVIRAIEREGIRRAAAATCVSDGIADRLLAMHGLERRPTVIRNVPPYVETPFRPAGERTDVLYHGIVAPGRALEAAIASVPFWRPEFSFTIRGPAEPSYLERLVGLAEAEGVAGRITFAPPVPMTSLVAEASRYDVGLFVLPGHSQQNIHVLPNKVFEYAMAGLALCVSDLPEMARLVGEHGLGVLVATPEPASIAAAVNGLDRPAIDAYKRNALRAATELCWETEGRRFLALVEAAFASARSVAA